MAVKKETAIDRYIGLAGDPMPTSVRVGSTYLAYDTDAEYITHDGTSWVLKDRLVRLVAGTAAFGIVGHDITGIGHGVTVVTTAGTDLVLAASTACKLVIIQAQTDNTGVIAVGATGVDATVATGTGVALYAGESVTIPCDNLADIYIDATVSGEGVRYSYFS